MEGVENWFDVEYRSFHVLVHELLQVVDCVLDYCCPGTLSVGCENSFRVALDGGDHALDFCCLGTLSAGYENSFHVALEGNNHVLDVLVLDCVGYYTVLHSAGCGNSFHGLLEEQGGCLL